MKITQPPRPPLTLEDADQIEIGDIQAEEAALRRPLPIIGCAWVSGFCFGFVAGIFAVPVLRALGAW